MIIITTMYPLDLKFVEESSHGLCLCVDRLHNGNVSS